MGNMRSYSTVLNLSCDLSNASHYDSDQSVAVVTMYLHCKIRVHVPVLLIINAVCSFHLDGEPNHKIPSAELHRRQKPFYEPRHSTSRNRCLLTTLQLQKKFHFPSYSIVEPSWMLYCEPNLEIFPLSGRVKSSMQEALWTHERTSKQINTL